MPDADAVTESMDEDGALAAMEQGAVWLQLATVGVVAAEALAELAALARAAYEKSSSAVELGHGDADMAATYFATAPARTFTEP